MIYSICTSFFIISNKYLQIKNEFKTCDHVSVIVSDYRLYKEKAKKKYH